MQPLESIVQALVAKGKGILAADESFPTIEKRFKTINLPSTEENRRTYRELLFTAPGAAEFISGVILFDETIRQPSSDGTPFPELLSRQGMIPGIKVDMGTKPLPKYEGEKITRGLDGLRDRLIQYRQLGARFSKWRAVITIGPGMPTAYCLKANAHALARYAAMSQESGLVPIVEPEVLMKGDHSIERCCEVTETTLERVFHALFEARVELEQMLLKVNMVLPGEKCPHHPGADEVAQVTLHCLRRAVPPAVPGIMFLSGGQSELAATIHLNAINESRHEPWDLSFSYGRALQAAALTTWGGHPHQITAAQQEFLHRARCVGAARDGRYSQEMEFRTTKSAGHAAV